jgi:hypothetical protein
MKNSADLQQVAGFSSDVKVAGDLETISSRTGRDTAMRALSFALCACGGLVQGDDAGVPDAHANDGPCIVTPPPMFTDKGCNAQRDAVCEQWAQTLATYGASICVVPNGQYAKCGAPDCNGNCCGGGPVCSTDEVCASLTQGGARQCLKACAGY